MYYTTKEEIKAINIRKAPIAFIRTMQRIMELEEIKTRTDGVFYIFENYEKAKARIQHLEQENEDLRKKVDTYDLLIDSIQQVNIHNSRIKHCLDAIEQDD